VPEQPLILGILRRGATGSGTQGDADAEGIEGTSRQAGIADSLPCCDQRELAETIEHLDLYIPQIREGIEGWNFSGYLNGQRRGVKQRDAPDSAPPCDQFVPERADADAESGNHAKTSYGDATHGLGSDADTRRNAPMVGSSVTGQDERS
jgi:hypothetical protein